MAIEYLRGGIFLFVGDEGHFDSLVSRGYYSPVPDHEIPYDLRLEIQDRLDARGVKGSSARQSTGTNEAGKNCWAPNKPCGKACRVNCKSGSGTVGAKTKKAAAQQMVSEALAKKKGAAGGKKTKAAKPSGPKPVKQADRDLRASVLGRKSKPRVKDGPEPKAEFSKKISKKDYGAEEARFIADVRAGKVDYGGDHESYANRYEQMDPKSRRSEIGGMVESRILGRRESRAKKNLLPKLLEHHDITPEEHQAGVEAVYARMAGTPLGQQPGFDKMSQEEKMARFGVQGANQVKRTREQVAADQSFGRQQRDRRAGIIRSAKEAGFSKDEMAGSLAKIIKEREAQGFDAPRNSTQALEMYGEEALAALGKSGKSKGKSGRGTTSKSTKSRKPAAPKATKAKAASAPKATKAKAPSRQKQLEAQLAADPFFADIMRRRRDSRYDSFNFIPYYATTGLPTLVDPFGAFR